jgi:aminoglycoside 6'-N-acetyltransferase
MYISFRKIQESDFSLLYKWRNEDFVKQWFDPDKEITLEWIEKKFFSKISENSYVHPYIAQINGNDVAYIQTYFHLEEPEYERHFKDYTADENTMGVDLHIGNRDYLYKGYGKHILSSFLEEIVFSDRRVQRCLIDPNPKNTVAIKTYKKVGFKYIKTVKVDNEEFYIMEINRKDFKPLL